MKVLFLVGSWERVKGKCTPILRRLKFSHGRRCAELSRIESCGGVRCYATLEMKSANQHTFGIAGTN